MNDQTWLNRIIAWIKAVIKKLIRKIKGGPQEGKKSSTVDLLGLQKQFERSLAALKGLGKAFKTTKDSTTRKSKHTGTKNKNQKRNKVRAKMAVESNRINRIRVKRWKH
jgi:hypothetical protein